MKHEGITRMPEAKRPNRSRNKTPQPNKNPPEATIRHGVCSDIFNPLVRISSERIPRTRSAPG
ncbi:hypothetical protein [Paraburkholderia hospita]|uniref:hypothetical protein n=1 Tax=Paraburkholderia hospita TaxID=169430 RepID=UPI000DEEE88A|nr:hypothetical protein [Paraburkholderia hospita]AXF05071.1 hypothetical protein CUJ88_42900 [Paraburkholderia hospita]